MNKKIVLDLDGVIADIDKGINDSLLSRGIDDYDYSDWLITHHECDLSNDIMQNSLFWLNLVPLQDAWYQVNHWFSIGYDVYIVTARRTEASMSVTAKWLDNWQINTMPPIFAKMGEKHTIINEINPLFVVEDNPHEVKILIDEGHKVFLRKAWYNQGYWSSLPVINKLSELDDNA